MSETVNRYDLSGYGGGMIEAEDGVWYHEDDYASLEQECERLKRDRKACWAEFKVMTRSCLDAERERDAALNQADCLRDLLTRCQEHLEPHRDAALWSDVCAALGPKP